MLSGSTATVVGTPVKVGVPATFQFWITGTSGTCTATAKLWASNDATCLTSQTNAAKTLLATTSALTGTGVGSGIAIATDQWFCTVPYQYFWAEVSAISGTGTAVYGKASS